VITIPVDEVAPAVSAGAIGRGGRREQHGVQEVGDMTQTASSIRAEDLLVHGTFALRSALDRLAPPGRHVACEGAEARPDGARSKRADQPVGVEVHEP
jgi:hypothetical protein